MVNVKHIVIIIALFILCIWVMFSFLNEDKKIDEEDLGNSYNSNEIQQITGNNATFNNSQGENYSFNVHNNIYGLANIYGQLG